VSESKKKKGSKFKNFQVRSGGDGSSQSFTGFLAEEIKPARGANVTREAAGSTGLSMGDFGGP